MDVVVSKHADLRLRKRFGLNRKGVKRMAERVWENGKTDIEFSGDVASYVRHLSNRHRSIIKIYGEGIYVFQKDEESYVLVTAMMVDKKCAGGRRIESC